MKNFLNTLRRRLMPAVIFTVLVFFMTSCKKLVEVDSPINAVTNENAFNEDGTAAAVLNGIYAEMSKSEVPGGSSTGFLSYYPGLSADELVLRETQTNNYYLNTLSADIAPSYWSNAYTEVYNLNTALEGLRSSNKLNQALKNHLYGQALFLRALTYFYLTGLYGDAALALTTDYKINNALPRIPQKQIYTQLISDLKEAELLIHDGYVGSDGKSPTNSRITPNKSAVLFLLARIYLYNGDYQLAEEAAEKVISQTSLYKLEDMNRVFLAESKEAIWSLQPVNAGWNTQDGRTFVIPSGGPDNSHQVALNKRLVNGFESGDLRRKNWIDSVTADGIKYYYPTKYKIGSYGMPVTEYKMVFRLGELFLIRAEARAWQNNLSGALEDLNEIRRRADLLGSKAESQQEILEAIQHERQVELFTEWGDRWLNMRRTGKINQIMSSVTADKGKIWNENQALYPVPKQDLDYNRSLKQNPGY